MRVIKAAVVALTLSMGTVACEVQPIFGPGADEALGCALFDGPACDDYRPPTPSGEPTDSSSV